MREEHLYHQLYNQVRGAHRRYNLILFVQALSRCLFYSLIALTLLLALLKLTPWQIPVWTALFMGILLSIPAALLWFWRDYRGLKHTAILVDDHLHLKEKISTALEFAQDLQHSELRHNEPQHQEWVRAQLHDALREVQRLKLTNAFPWKAPLEARRLWAPALAMLMIGYVIPQLQFYTRGLSSSAQADTLDQQTLEREVQTLIQRQLALEQREKSQNMETAAKMKQDVQDLADRLSKGKLETREALAEISKVESKWREQREQLLAMQNLSPRPMPMSQMKTADELAQDIQAGNYAQAKKELENLQKKLKMDTLSEEAKQRLAKEIQSIAQNLDPNSPLSGALEQAALELTENDLSAAMKSLQLAEMSLDDLDEMLKQVALLEESLDELSQAKRGLLGKCKICGGVCEGENGQCSLTGPWKEGDTQKPGGGMGGAGIGKGGNAQFEETETERSKAAVNADFQNAPIAGLLNTQDAPIKQPAALLPTGTSISLDQDHEQAMTKEHVPAAYRNRVKRYFDAIQSGE